jgi:hypothetical protein
LSKPNREALQRFLNSKGASLTVDGAVGPATRAALFTLFANRNAPAITPAEVAMTARGLGAPPENLRAVAKVESSGSPFLDTGHPKILWERHWFWRRIGLKVTASLPGQWIAHPNPGGYTLDADKDGINDSWEKLVEACARNPVAAFESCSWGKFQIMGGHWKALGYPSVFEFAYSMVESELGHYRARAAFIKANRLEGALRAIGTSPSQNERFARGYNGAGFRKHDYHGKLARAMQRELGA